MRTLLLVMLVLAGADLRGPDCPKKKGKQDVTIEMTMTSPACPAGPQLLGNSKMETSKLEGVGEVDVKLVMVPPWTPDRMSEDAKDKLGDFLEPRLPAAPHHTLKLIQLAAKKLGANFASRI